MVASVERHEAMKLRCLNGAHSALAYLGYLAGHETVAEAVAAPGFAPMLERLWREEIAPTVPPPEGEDLAAYADALLERYHNPAIRHRLWQIAMDGSQKLPQRILGTAADNLDRGRVPDGLCLAVAAWMRYVGGMDEDGRPIDVRDPLAGRLRDASDGAASPEDAVATLLEVREVFAPALAGDARLRGAVARHHAALGAEGAAACVRRYAAGGAP